VARQELQGNHDKMCSGTKYARTGSSASVDARQGYVSTSVFRRLVVTNDRPCRSLVHSEKFVPAHNKQHHRRISRRLLETSAGETAWPVSPIPECFPRYSERLGSSSALSRIAVILVDPQLSQTRLFRRPGKYMDPVPLCQG
jgi:hypothetical protein